MSRLACQGNYQPSKTELQTTGNIASLNVETYSEDVMPNKSANKKTTTEFNHEVNMEDRSRSAEDLISINLQ